MDVNSMSVVLAYKGCLQESDECCYICLRKVCLTCAYAHLRVHVSIDAGFQRIFFCNDGPCKERYLTVYRCGTKRKREVSASVYFDVGDAPNARGSDMQKTRKDGSHGVSASQDEH